MKKNVIFIIVSLLYIGLFAQEYPFISKDLHIMDDAELSTYKVQFSADTPIYDEEGNTIKPEQINDILKSGNFVPLVFGDKDHIAKALVFRKATQEEKEEFRKWQAQQDPNANFTPGKLAPDFEITDINGKTYKLSNLKGKIVVLNFWFTTCPPCISEIPELNKIASKYKKSGVVFLAVTFEDESKIKPFLVEHPFYYNIVSDVKLVKNYGISGFPTSMLIDKEGKIMFKKTGVFTKALDETIKMYVGEN